jgi:hypothetical protein
MMTKLKARPAADADVDVDVDDGIHDFLNKHEHCPD